MSFLMLEFLSTLFSRQRSKLIQAKPADLLAEDWLSFIGFSFCSVFRIYKVVAPLGCLLPFQSFVALIRFSDRIGSDHPGNVAFPHELCTTSAHLMNLSKRLPTDPLVRAALAPRPGVPEFWGNLFPKFEFLRCMVSFFYLPNGKKIYELIYNPERAGFFFA